MLAENMSREDEWTVMPCWQMGTTRWRRCEVGGKAVSVRSKDDPEL